MRTSDPVLRGGGPATRTPAGASAGTRAGHAAGGAPRDGTGGRIVDAALSCFAELGVSGTTLDDVASAACCSRATVYRYFPGKRALQRGVVEAEARRLARELDAVADEVARGSDDLEDLLVAVLVHVGREAEGHRAFERVLSVEPEILLPHMAFEGAERLFAVASMLVGPLLSRHLPPDEAARTGDWLARLALSYVCGPAEHVSLVDADSVRHLVRTFVLPGLRDAPETAPEPTASESTASGSTASGSTAPVIPEPSSDETTEEDASWRRRTRT